eukprot:6006417-Pyramimonas_sp.AAC.2
MAPLSWKRRLERAGQRGLFWAQQLARAVQARVELRASVSVDGGPTRQPEHMATGELRFLALDTLHLGVDFLGPGSVAAWHSPGVAAWELHKHRFGALVGYSVTLVSEHVPAGSVRMLDGLLAATMILRLRVALERALVPAA